MLPLGYLEAKNNIYWSFNKVLFKIWLSCVATGRGWGCGSWAEGWERTAWAGGQAQLSLAGARGGEGGYDSVNRHWGSCQLADVAVGPCLCQGSPAPFLELSSNLCTSALLQSLPLYLGLLAKQQMFLLLASFH